MPIQPSCEKKCNLQNSQEGGGNDAIAKYVDQKHHNTFYGDLIGSIGWCNQVPKCLQGDPKCFKKVATE